MSNANNLLIGAAAVALGVSETVLPRLTDAGVLDVPRAGNVRIFPGDRLTEYRGILERGGHVRPVPDVRA